MLLLFLHQLGFGGTGNADVVPGVLEDLNTVFIPYLADLRDASALAVLDTTSLVADDQDAKRASDVTDLNTAYAVALS